MNTRSSAINDSHSPFLFPIIILRFRFVCIPQCLHQVYSSKVLFDNWWSIKLMYRTSIYSPSIREALNHITMEKGK